MLDERLCLAVVELEARADSLGRVVRAAFLAGSLEQALDADLVRDLEREDHGQLAADLAQCRVERVGLRRRARKAVQHESGSGVGLLEPFADQLDHDLVGNQPAGLVDRLDAKPERGLRFHCDAQHVARRDVRNPELGRDPLGLRSFPGSLRTQQQNVHRGPERLGSITGWGTI